MKEPLINIAFVMNGAKPPRGGEFLTHNLITRLRRDMFHPLLVYAHEGVIVRQLKEAGIDNVQIPLSSKVANIYPRETNLHNPFFIVSFLCRLVIGGSILKLNKVLRENNIHLIYCADNISKFMGGIAGKMAGVRVVAHCHDDFKEDSLGRSMRILYLVLLDKILAVSKRVSSFFAKKGKISDKVITIYNGIDANFFNPENIDCNLKMELGIRNNAVVIGSIGVAEKDKGQKYLIEALSKLKSEAIGNIVCVICGTGPEEAHLKELVNALGLQDNILFLGFRRDINRILRMLDIVVITSQTIESFSMVAVEAMAMKVPVIATNVGALPEVVDDGKTGILVSPGNADILCRAIKYLAKNPDVRLEMGENGRQRVLEKFTIEENVRKTEKVFLEMIRGG